MSAMVYQTRIIFGLEDVVALRFQCARCCSEVVIPFTGEIERGKPNLPKSCPQCGVALFNGEGDHPGSGETLDQQVVRVLWRLLHAQDQRPGRLRFELEKDD